MGLHDEDIGDAKFLVSNELIDVVAIGNCGVPM